MEVMGTKGWWIRNNGERREDGLPEKPCVGAGGLAFARTETAQAGLPSASKISNVVSPSMSVISATLNLPLS
jgi:hypothetical protein